MLDKLWRYSINTGEHGGIVIADTLDEANQKVRKAYEIEDDELLIWKMEDDDFFDKENPDVLDCYGWWT